METIKLADDNHLLEEGLEVLHHESQHWSSEIKLWKIELSFFQKLLDKNSQKFTSIDEKKRMSHFQNLIIYYDGEVLDRFVQNIRKHEQYLANEMAESGKLDDAKYRKIHREVGSHVASFRVEFNVYKNGFFDFIEKAI